MYNFLTKNEEIDYDRKKTNNLINSFYILDLLIQYPHNDNFVKQINSIKNNLEKIGFTIEEIENEKIDTDNYFLHRIVNHDNITIKFRHLLKKDGYTYAPLP